MMVCTNKNQRETIQVLFIRRYRSGGCPLRILVGDNDCMYREQKAPSGHYHQSRSEGHPCVGMLLRIFVIMIMIRMIIKSDFNSVSLLLISSSLVVELIHT